MHADHAQQSILREGVILTNDIHVLIMKPMVFYCSYFLLCNFWELLDNYNMYGKCKMWMFNF